MRRSFVRRATFFAVAATLGFAFGVHAQALDSIEAITGDTAVAPYAPRTAHGIRKTVIVLLSGDSVAALQQRFGRELSQAERNAIKVARAADHAVAKREIERRGGDVLATLYGALNGIKVSIPESRLAALRAMPGVVAVKSVGTYERTNATSVPLIGAPQVWQGTAHFQGQGVKIAVIDTGIDYTHANFGGPGTVAAYTAAKATNTSPADPSLFGPAAPKVKGGTDLVGDAYNGGNTPVPDPNPLDCEFTSGSVGHGSHVAGTAAGFGVKADGTTFAGPWNAAAYTPGAFSIGPGVAPQAEVYSVRVFGCSGTTNVVAEAIDWAVANGMNVINMSLGSSYGNIGNGDAGSLAEQTAVANAAAAGIVVVASSGNAGPTPYITGAPAVFPGAISVAATDALADIPWPPWRSPEDRRSRSRTPTTPSSPTAANWPIVVLRNPNGTVSLGCNPDEYDKTKNGGIDITGKLVVTVRGTCARVFRAGAAQHFGGAAAAMINTRRGLSGLRRSDSRWRADSGRRQHLRTGDDPVLRRFAVRHRGADRPDRRPGARERAGQQRRPPRQSRLREGRQLLVGRTAHRRQRPAARRHGPRRGDGVDGVGNRQRFRDPVRNVDGRPARRGCRGARQAGQSDLVGGRSARGAGPDGEPEPCMQDYSPRNEGSGLVQPLAAVGTQAVVRTPDESLSFGFADLLTDFSATKQVTVHNAGPKAVQFNIAVTKSVGPASVTVTAPPSVIVNGNSDAQFPVTLSVPASAGTGGTSFQDIGGYVQLTPSSSRLNGNVKLSVPYYLVTHGRSNLAASLAAGNLGFTNVGRCPQRDSGLLHLGLVPAGAAKHRSERHSCGGYEVVGYQRLLRRQHPQPHVHRLGVPGNRRLHRHQRRTGIHAEQGPDRHQSGGVQLDPRQHGVRDGPVPDRCELQHQRQRQPLVQHHAADRQLHRAAGGSEGGYRYRRPCPDRRRTRDSSIGCTTTARMASAR